MHPTGQASTRKLHSVIGGTGFTCIQVTLLQEISGYIISHIERADNKTQWSIGMKFKYMYSVDRHSKSISVFFYIWGMTCRMVYLNGPQSTSEDVRDLIIWRVYRAAI